MFTSRNRRQRRGSTTVEFAIVAPVVFLVILAQIVGGMGVFRYLEVARLARDGARYASTHGGLYQQEGIADRTGQPAIANSEDLHAYLVPKTVLLDAENLQIGVTWTAPGSYSPRNMPTYVDMNPDLIPPGQTVIGNNVIVTVSYQWIPEVFKIGPFTLKSTSEMPMSY
jgi:Flp pilus assembly protein TadG